VTPVERYLDALRAQDWDGLRSVLAPDVTRRGPFGDDFEGRDAYVGFLAETFTHLADYTLEVHRSFGDATRVCVELAETATVAGTRTRTEEAVVFGTAGDVVTDIAVFLRRSTPA
jgi:ketosteroid isomerase-like protein